MSQSSGIMSVEDKNAHFEVIKKTFSNLCNATIRNEYKDVIGELVTYVIAYIGEYPYTFDCPFPLTESECLNKVGAVLNERSSLLDTDSPGDVFKLYYDDATQRIIDPRLRELMSNLLLCTFENESQSDDIDVLYSKIASKPGDTHRSTTSTTSSTNGKSSSGKLVPYMDDRCSYNSSQYSIGLENVPISNYMIKINRQDQVELSHDVIQNAIYSFIGVQGKYLKKDVISGRFKLDPLAIKNLTAVQAGMLLRLSELGFYHDMISKFANISTGFNAIGCIGQAFMSKLKLELSDFHGKVAMLQDQVNEHRQNEMRAYVDRDHNYIDRHRDPVTLLKLLCWYVKPLMRLQWLTKIADKCQMKKGGVLLSVLYDFLNNGDPYINTLATDLLTSCCAPLVRMISKWMLEGGIEDSHGEFFIESLSEVGIDRLWHDKFRLRHIMLPKFIKLELAEKILKAGKSINFLREICQVEKDVSGCKELRHIMDNHVPFIFSHVPDTRWHAAIETCYAQTSKQVLDIMVGPHKLLDHLHSMRRFLLLGQGDFVSLFIEHIKDELKKTGSEIFSHDLSAMLDTALRCSNAQIEDPEIVNHLDVVVKTAYTGDCGWDVISLQYSVRGPLATMLESTMPTYKTLFKPLWRIKHMEFVLSNKVWKEQMGNAKALRSLRDEIGRVTYKLNLFTAEITHFVHQIQYYVLFEVIECNWVELQKRIQLATSLDDILDAHSKFLKDITKGCFVNTEANLGSYLEMVYDNIIWLEIWQDKFYGKCFKELAARQSVMETILQSEQNGTFGLTTEQKMERDQERKMFEQSVLSYGRTLDDATTAYGKAIVGFMLALNCSDEPNLQLFGTRLDFNEYYKKRDTNLSKPLTFEHMRMSLVMGSSKGNMASRYNL